MQLFVGLENNVEGRSLAWALDHPGCFVYGIDGPEALADVPAAFSRYQAWIAAHTPDSWLAEVKDIDAQLSEVWDVYTIDKEYRRVAEGGYDVNAWFSTDWWLLTRQEIELGLKLLEFSRQDLLAVSRDLPDEVLDRKYPGERWSIRGVVGHVGGAEWWYLDRLDLAGIAGDDVPDEAFERLDVVRRRFVEVLPQLEGVELARGKWGEWWSPRKMLRRAVWHELDHVEHIRKLLRL